MCPAYCADMRFEHLGFNPDFVDYLAAWDRQREVHATVVAGDEPDTVLLLEHTAVYTAGRRTELHERPFDGTPVIDVDRGGKITWHGPGQLVGYPILDLGPTPDAAAHLRRMEEAVIRTASEFGVTVHRREDVQTGVWHGDDKVCAIGVRLMRARVTLHGFALNCDPVLSWWDGIVACGLPNHGVTSLTRLAGRSITVPEVRPVLQHHLAEVFDLAFRDARWAGIDIPQPTAV